MTTLKDMMYIYLYDKWLRDHPTISVMVTGDQDDLTSVKLVGVFPSHINPSCYNLMYKNLLNNQPASLAGTQYLGTSKGGLVNFYYAGTLPGSASGPNVPTPAPGPLPPDNKLNVGPLYGWWYYSAGCVCENNKTIGGIQNKGLVTCEAAGYNLDKYLNLAKKKGGDSHKDASLNTNFWLGNGGINYLQCNTFWTSAPAGQNAASTSAGGQWCTGTVSACGTGSAGGDGGLASPSKLNVINFGGWGSCSETCHESGGTNCDTNSQHDDWHQLTYCRFGMKNCKIKVNANPGKNFCGEATGENQCQGPNEVWFDENLQFLPNPDQIVKAGYNAISIDIEGVWHDATITAVWTKAGEVIPSPKTKWGNLTAENLGKYLKLYRSHGVSVIITTTGNPLSPQWGGMCWFSDEKQDYRVNYDTGEVSSNGSPTLGSNALKYGIHYDYICLMYYNKINDTELYTSKCKEWREKIYTAGYQCNSTANDNWIANNIQNEWIEKYKVPKKAIIAGLSFGSDEALNNVLPGILPLAQGGISVWAMDAGSFCYYSSTELCTGETGSCPPCNFECKNDTDCRNHCAATPIYKKGAGKNQSNCIADSGGGGGSGGSCKNFSDFKSCCPFVPPN